MITIRYRRRDIHDRPNLSTMIHLQWHCGEHRPMEITEVDDVISVTADGEELTAVMNIKHLPVLLYDRGAWQRTQTWYGDHAKFIVSNIVRS